MSAQTLVKKRLHVSGLTPAISSADISSRFSSFGDVKAVDGIGALDGNGQPRKFGYVTIETTQPKLTRCVNLLSGSTWKGAKLRIGDARPDYLQVLEKEKAPVQPILTDRAQKKAKKLARKARKRLPKGVHGRESSDMSVVGLHNVARRKGWKKTMLNHLIYPIRVRPLRPLPPVRAGSSRSKPPRTSKKAPYLLTRARRTIIDPTRYNAVHITGASGMLGEENVTYAPEPLGQENPPAAERPPVVVDAISAKLQDERRRDLAIMELVMKEPRGALSEDEDEGQLLVTEAPMLDTKMDEESVDTVDDSPAPAQSLVADVHMRSLKQMFAPREEEGGFSLLSQLDLESDIEFEEEAPAPASVPEKSHRPAPSPSIAHVVHGPESTFELNPQMPMFFPIHEEERRGKGAKLRDLYDVARDKGWVGFWRTETEDEIRKQWDESKAELTREFKRRHREAVKRRRRGMAGGGGDAEPAG
ncbi:hypothetical protein BOTBODRAFT_39434 [Botryobasidium botryosum FD-172 SS1]|uniref:RRM domain-containing protein n=1 Tax=Botryobasidium botryosum (strain FD-172 SS1) TaxID=930990 RepID=A0A067LU39_BOTB1|nr:hypothetical protein BOTBODRAFT_39434 [Botryobasidium botryosum FD-172 SS1]